MLRIWAVAFYKDPSLTMCYLVSCSCCIFRTYPHAVSNWFPMPPATGVEWVGVGGCGCGESNYQHPTPPVGNYVWSASFNLMLRTDCAREAFYGTYIIPYSFSDLFQGRHDIPNWRGIKHTIICVNLQVSCKFKLCSRTVNSDVVNGSRRFSSLTTNYLSW